MEQWQFLIQKQGDRTWRPLESPKGEILAGRYRVLARSHRPNTDVDVRITYFSSLEVPPKRRIHKRSRRTNSEGLMAVIPYTNFKPGIWELQCSGDLMSDILGQSWKYTVHLQVLSPELDAEVDPNGEESDSLPQADTLIESNDSSHTHASVNISVDTTNSVTAELANETESFPTTELQTQPEDGLIDQPVSPVWLKGETAEQILQHLIDLALPSSERLLEDETVEDATATPAALPLLLTLDQQTYVARWGEVLVIHGRVELTQIGYRPSFSSLELGIDLRSPVQLEILTQIRQPLANQMLPLIINSPILIPAECESKLILADISLYGAVGDIPEVRLLTSHSFTITADVTQLLAITAAKPSTANLLDDQSTESAPAANQEPQPTVSIGLELFNLVKSIKPNQTLLLNPSPNQPLPPEIKRRLLPAASLEASTLKKSADSRAPQLPNLPPLPAKVASTVAIAEPPTIEEDLDKVEAIAPINLEELVIRQRRLPMISSTFPYLKQLLPASEQSAVQTTTPDASVSQADEPFEPLDLTVFEDDNIPGLTADKVQLPNKSVAEVATHHQSKFIDADVAEVTPSSGELVDESTAEVTPPPTELITNYNPYSSPLIRKWLYNQGFSLPEPIYLPDQDYDTDFPLEQIITEQQVDVADTPETPTLEMDLLPFNLDAVGIEEETEAVPQEDTTTLEDLKPVSPLPVPPPPPYFKTASAWLAQEIVVDDTYSEPEPIPEEKPPVQQQPSGADLSYSLGMIAANIESLPVPQMHVPEGELIAGKSVKVRVELPDVSAEVVVKFWVEDCQTRWLVDGPHLLKMVPNPFGNFEVITQLNIPFGCLEIRLEAIALDTATLQESHKVSITRTVIPPNLPALHIDELLWI
jgi:hypothetical protein